MAKMRVNVRDLKRGDILCMDDEGPSMVLDIYRNAVKFSVGLGYSREGGEVCKWEAHPSFNVEIEREEPEPAPWTEAEKIALRATALVLDLQAAARLLTEHGYTVTPPKEGEG